MGQNPIRAFLRPTFIVAMLFLMTQFPGGIFAALDKNVDPVKHAAWEKAQAEAAKKIADFDAAVKSGNPEQVRKAGLDLQSDPIAVQKLNQSERPDLVNAHNEVTGEIKSNAKANIKENMAAEWNKAHPNDPPITKNDVEIYEPTNYKDPSAKPKSGQDWDVTVRVKGKDVPPTQSQKVVEKSYYEAAGGEKTFGKPAPGVTSEEAAAAAAHRQAVETTHGKSAEAYTEPDKILGTATEKPKTGAKLTDSEQLTQAIEYKSNIASNKAADARAAGNDTEAVRQEMEQMRQASKQYDKITKPRVEAVGGKVNAKVDDGMNILRDAGTGNISPEQARAKLAEIGETPESMISKASGQAEAAQKLKSAALPETTGAKVLKAAGTAMIAVDIGSTAQDIKEDLKKGDVEGAAIKTGEAGANAVTGGAYGTVKMGLEKKADKAEAYNQIANANKQNEAAYDLQAEKKLREAGVSREDAAKIMEAKAKGDDSVLENKFKELGVKPPEKIVEKAPEGDDTAGERAVAVGTGMVDSAKKAGTFVKETAQDVTEITTGMAEKGVATEVVNQTKENISDAYGTYKDNKNAEKTTADFKQGVMDRLIAKGATPEGAEKAANALVNDGDASKVKKLNDLLDMKKGIPPKDAKPETPVMDPKTPATGTPDTGWGAAVAAGMKNIQDSVAKGGDALKTMYEKYKADQEKTAKEKAEKEKVEKEKVEKEKVEKNAVEKGKVEKEKSENEKAPIEATADKGPDLTAAAAQAAALVQGLNGGPALPPGTHEEVSGWADDKNGKSRLTYIKDANGNVLGGYTTHFDPNGKEIGREDFKANPNPEVPAPATPAPEVPAPAAATPGSAPVGPAPSPKEVLKQIDDSIVKVEEALRQYDAQIAAVVAQNDEESASAKETLMAYRPMIVEQLEKLKVLRQEKALQAEKWTDPGK